MQSDKEIRRREFSLIAILTGGHLFSHAYYVVLVPLFAIIVVELDATYIELGVFLSAYSLASFVFQVPTGMLVDKYGPKCFLLGGLTFTSVCVILMGMSASYWPMVILSFLAGMGDSVFHPSGYKIMSARIRKKNLGKAYAAHNFSGYVGWFAMPLSMIFLVGILGWRLAVITVGILGIGMAVIIFFNRRQLSAEGGKKQPRTESSTDAKVSIWAMMISLPVVLLLIFYAISSMANSGLRGFTPVILPQLFGMSDLASNYALTMWFGGTMVGVLLGGVVADQFKRFDLVASIGYIAGAAAIGLVGYKIFSASAVPFAYLFGGFMVGVISPSRDMMVRSVAPPERIGQAFGFVSMGHGVGGFIGPIIFGWVLDYSRAENVLLAGSVMLLAALAVALLAAVVGRVQSPVPAE